MNESACHISVVVISFNGIEFINDCLSSTYASLKDVGAEVIVVDNHSTDGTIDVIQSRYPRAVLIRNDDNWGFARAVNQGLEIARGEYILLLNQDTRIRDKAIAALAERMSRESAIGTIGPKFVGFDGQLQKSARAFPRYRDVLFEMTGLSYLFPRSRIFSHWKMGWFNHKSERDVDQPMGAALMVSRELVDRIGPFDESFGIFFNDVDFCRRAREAGFKNLYFPDAVVEHFVGGSTRKRRSRMIIESHRSMFRYFRKYSRGKKDRLCLYCLGIVLFVSAVVRGAVHYVIRK